MGAELPFPVDAAEFIRRVEELRALEAARLDTDAAAKAAIKANGAAADAVAKATLPLREWTEGLYR